MSNLEIILANGDLAKSDRLRTFFDRIFEAEDSGNEFPVNLEDVWRISYASKGAAVKALRKNYDEGVEFQSFVQVVKRDVGGTTEEVFELTVSCLEHFAVRSNKEVFQVYINCRKAMRALIRPVTPGTYREALTALLAEVTQREALEAQAAIDAPKIAFTDAVAIAGNPIPISAVAKYLKFPGVGRNKLFKILREDKILRANNEPYQHQIDSGHFAVELQVFEAGEKGGRTTGTTRCTSKGLIYLAQKYKHLT